jgi:DNA replication protein DnaC
MRVESKPCEDCGKTVERELPDGPLAHVLEQHRTLCVGCMDRESREDEAAADAVEAERQARVIEKRTRALDLPDKYAGADLSMVHGAPLAGCLAWASGRTNGLVLTGAFGVGKTYAAAAAARRMVERRACKWVSAPLLMARLGSGLDSKARQWAVDTLTDERTALVLDDLDKTRPTAYGAEQMFLAVDVSTSENRPLLITTNLSLDQLAGHFPDPYGEALVSRLVEFCTVVKLEGADRRLGVVA